MPRSLTLAIGCALFAAASSVLAQPPATPAVTAVTPSATPPINTAGPINRPIIASIGPDTYAINEFGGSCMFLIVGTRRALVIDAGSGFFDFKRLIESLTKLPYDVAITHGHRDHAGGIGQFDAVYMDPADVPMAKAITYEDRVEYGRIQRNLPPEILGGMSTGYRNVWAYDDSSVTRYTKLPEFKSLHDGQVFDLGGRKVTAIHIGNHTPGSTMFLDDKSRILFTGDVTLPNAAANDAVSTFLRKLIRIRDMRSQYDRIFMAHTAYGNLIDVLPEDPKMIDDQIENFRSVLRGTAQLTVIPDHLNPGHTFNITRYGTAMNSFNPDRLWEPGEAHVVP